MDKMNIRITFTEDVLGLSPSNKDIYREFIASKSEDASTVEEEVATIGVDGVVEKGKTVFPRTENGEPFLYDYQIKGFFKDTCGGLKRVKGTVSNGMTAYKKIIDKLIFPTPRQIVFQNYGEIGECQRPLRAQTAQGERVSLAISEQVNAGAYVEFTVEMFDGGLRKSLIEWLDYGKYSGISQWRNSGKGRFVWEELDDDGNVIGGNKK